MQGYGFDMTQGCPRTPEGFKFIARHAQSMGSWSFWARAVVKKTPLNRGYVTYVTTPKLWVSNHKAWSSKWLVPVYQSGNTSLVFLEQQQVSKTIYIYFLYVYIYIDLCALRKTKMKTLCREKDLNDSLKRVISRMQAGQQRSIDLCSTTKHTPSCQEQDPEASRIPKLQTFKYGASRIKQTNNWTISHKDQSLLFRMLYTVNSKALSFFKELLFGGRWRLANIPQPQQPRPTYSLCKNSEVFTPGKQKKLASHRHQDKIHTERESRFEKLRGGPSGPLENEDCWSRTSTVGENEEVSTTNGACFHSLAAVYWIRVKLQENREQSSNPNVL